jgi:hypothetical protein
MLWFQDSILSVLTPPKACVHVSPVKGVPLSEHQKFEMISKYLENYKPLSDWFIEVADHISKPIFTILYRCCGEIAV